MLQYPLWKDDGLKVKVIRYRCPSCSHGFTHYPSGVSQLQQSHRLVALVALLYSLGLSLESSSLVLFLLKKIGLGKTIVWWDIQRMGKAIRKNCLQRAKVEEVAGRDQTYLRIKGMKACLNIAVSPYICSIDGGISLHLKDIQVFLWPITIQKEL